MGGKISQQEVIDSANTMVATIMTNIALYCNSTSVSTQNITVECTPQGSTIYELNSGCSTCIANVKASALAYYDQQQQLWTRGVMAPQVKKPIDADFQNIIQEFITCSVVSCKACTFSDLSQSTTVQSVTTCEAFNNVQNNINQQLMTQITQQLTNNQDALSGFMAIFGRQTSDITYALATRISASLTNNVISDIENLITTDQTITWTASPISVTGWSQQNTQTNIQTYLSTNNILNSILTQDQWQLFQSVANDENTIDEVGNLIVGSIKWLTKISEFFVGKAVMAAICAVIFVAIVVVVYIAIKLITKAVKEQKMKDTHKLQEAQKLKYFKQF